MRPDSNGAPARIAEAVVAALAAALIAVYLRSAFATLTYPYPLEWMEGGSMDVIARVLQGLPVYTRPSADYVPYIYAPLYYWAGAAAARIVGLDFLAARLVSFLAMCGVATLIWAFVQRDGGGRLGAFAAVGLFIGTYYKALQWFHLARVDSLFLLLLLAGFYALRVGGRLRSAVLSGALLWLAFLTKQSTLGIAAVALPIVALDEWRRPALAGGTLLVLVAATTLVMDSRTGGWWSYFIFRLAWQHDVYGPALWRFWRYDIGRTMPVAMIVATVFAARALRHGDDRSTATFYTGLVAGALAGSWLLRIYYGSANVLMPAYAALAIALPIGMSLAAQGRGRRLMLASALALQLAILAQAVATLVPRTIPGPADRASGDRLVAFLKTVDGEVLIWDQRFVETRAGKKSWGLEAAAEDVLSSSDVATRDALIRDIIDAFQSGRLAGAIDPPAFLLQAVTFGAPVVLPEVRVVPMQPQSAPARYYPVVRR